MATPVPLALLVLSSFLPPFVYASSSSNAAVFLPYGQHEAALVVSPALCCHPPSDYSPLNKQTVCFWLSRASVLVWLLLNQPFFSFFLFSFILLLFPPFSSSFSPSFSSPSLCVCTAFWVCACLGCTHGGPNTHIQTLQIPLFIIFFPQKLNSLCRDSTISWKTKQQLSNLSYDIPKHTH